jgi:signal transduction histidine kinase/CheY-like chemotaxis protein
VLVSALLSRDILKLEPAHPGQGQPADVHTGHGTAVLALFVGLALTAFAAACLITEYRRSARVRVLIDKLSRDRRQDVSARHDAEKAGAALEAELRRAQKAEALGKLARGIAHDFNNFLTTIMANAQTARMDLVHGHPAVQSLDRINEASQRAASMVRQILAFARDQGQDRHLLQLEPVVSDAVKLLRSIVPATITIEAQLDSGCPAVLANVEQIHQVILNLGTNAAHAMRQGGLLEISLAPVQGAQAQDRNADLGAGSYARLTVKDNGHGMDAGTLERIFDPFFTTKPSGEGTGLGLSIVQSIVKHHEGAITVHSQPNQGTVFHLYFPAATSEAPQPVASLKPSPTGKTPHLLLVGGAAALTGNDGDSLAHLGYRTSLCASASDAVARFRQAPEQYDCVVSDLAMAGMSGLELAAECRKSRPGTPFILLSGQPSVLSADALRALGVCELLVKPCSPRMLADALQRAMGAGDK